VNFFSLLTGSTQLQPLHQGFLTWGASTPGGCWNQF